MSFSSWVPRERLWRIFIQFSLSNTQGLLLEESLLCIICTKTRIIKRLHVPEMDSVSVPFSAKNPIWFDFSPCCVKRVEIPSFAFPSLPEVFSTLENIYIWPDSCSLTKDTYVSRRCLAFVCAFFIPSCLVRFKCRIFNAAHIFLGEWGCQAKDMCSPVSVREHLPRARV